MIIQNISDQIQALSLIRSKWPEKNIGYLNFFLKENEKYCLECWEKNELVGVLLARKANKNNIIWLEIQIIIVKENRRRKGLGSSLLFSLEQICQKETIQFLFLNSGEDDLANGSLNFYLKNGFKIVGSVQNPAESLLYFQKDL